MNEELNKLAEQLHIAKIYTNPCFENGACEVDDKIIKFFCEELGFKAGSVQEIKQSSERLQDESFKNPVEGIFVVRQGSERLVVSTENKEENIEVYLALQGKHNKKKIATTQTVLETKTCGSKTYYKTEIKLKERLNIGYFDVDVVMMGKTFHTVLAVAPLKCYTTDEIESGRLWGFSLQLYSLKSKRNWGVGDFTDLKNFVRLAAQAGADIVGLNPLNTLFHDFPENASPYSSISRLFLNPIYIDVENVVGYRAVYKEPYVKEIEQAKNAELIDYTAVYNVKMNVLREIFAHIGKHNAAFEKYKKQKGEELNLFAIYQAIYHQYCQKVWGGFRVWPKGLQNPNSMDVAVFAEAHVEEIEFFKFLQFAAEKQLQEVYAEVQHCGLKIGLYRDLPVGVCKDSAELWADRYVFMPNSGAGAPPDVFFPQGQKWCLGAFNPQELKKRAYMPFTKILRANMAYAGALRIDHVMSLMRLFLIADNASEGTYLYYPFEDMLALLALESYLHKCAVVGESIGNVPDGFLDKLKENNIYAISVLWAERWCGNGDFKAPECYPERAFISVGTHDMSPLKMWWFGYELALKHQLGMIDDAGLYNAYKVRECERCLLLKVLDENGVWPQDNLRKANYMYGEGFPEGLDEAVHTLIAKSAGKVVMLQPEDIMGVDKLQNLPGTDRDKYPNWRQKLPVDLEDLENDVHFKRTVALVNQARQK